MKLLIKTFSN